MPKLLSRFMLIFGLVAATPLVYVVLFAWIERSLLPSDEHALLLTNAIVGAVLVGVWLFAWHDVVVWTKRRRVRTFGAVVWSVLAAIPLGFAIEAALGDDEAAIVLAGLAWFVVWVISVSLIWAETPAERAARLSRTVPHTIRCLACGYNMTGLREARCPECGATFTLDEIVASARQMDDPLG